MKFRFFALPRGRARSAALAGLFTLAVILNGTTGAASPSSPRKRSRSHSVTRARHLRAQERLATSSRSSVASAPVGARAETGPPNAGTPGSAGMRVAIDPETGAIVAPSAAQRRAFAESSAGSLDHSTVGLEIIELPDGTKIVHLGDRFMDYTIARVDSSGRIHTGCVQTMKDVRRALQGPAPAPAAPVAE